MPKKDTKVQFKMNPHFMERLTAVEELTLGLWGALWKEYAWDRVEYDTGFLQSNLEYEVQSEDRGVSVRCGIDVGVVPYAPYSEFRSQAIRSAYIDAVDELSEVMIDANKMVGRSKSGPMRRGSL